MGGVGEPPEPQARKPTTEGNVVQVQKRPGRRSAPAATRNSNGPTTRKPLPALLIFAGMVALIVAYQFLMH
jgi:hypothetical protein